MEPLFPDGPIQLVEDWDGKGSKFKIRAGCRYFRPEILSTGNKLIDGDMYQVRTLQGNLAAVWVARDQSIEDNLKYFCHGHSFGTWEKYQYSVIEVGKVLEDEWVRVSKPLKVSRTFFFGEVSFDSDVKEMHRDLLLAFEVGHDIIGMGSDAKGEIAHSFKVREMISLEKAFLDSIVSSKNTFGHFENSTTIRKQLTLVSQIDTLAFYISIRVAT